MVKFTFRPARSSRRNPTCILTTCDCGQRYVIYRTQMENECPACGRLRNFAGQKIHSDRRYYSGYDFEP